MFIGAFKSQSPLISNIQHRGPNSIQAFLKKTKCQNKPVVVVIPMVVPTGVV